MISGVKRRPRIPKQSPLLQLHSLLLLPCEDLSPIVEDLSRARMYIDWLKADDCMMSVLTTTEQELLDAVLFGEPACGVCEDLEFAAGRTKGAVDEKPADRCEEKLALRADRSPGTGDRRSRTDDSDASG